MRKPIIALKRLYIQSRHAEITFQRRKLTKSTGFTHRISLTLHTLGKIH